jgi:putative endonuclease
MHKQFDPRLVAGSTPIPAKFKFPDDNAPGKGCKPILTAVAAGLPLGLIVLTDVIDSVTGRAISMSQWYVYIVQCGDGSLYTGIAKDVERRVAEHNAGQGARYTRGRGPVTLVYNERVKDRPAALRREYEIKKLRSPAKHNLIAGHGI